MLATVRTFSLLGVAAREVRVEVDVRRGLPTFVIVGLPDRAVRESSERVRAAISNSGFEFPLARITVNLAPASLRKAGPGFDLAIAAAVLVASEQLPAGALDKCAVAGELALDGSIRAAAGALSMAEEAVKQGLEGIVVAPASGPEAALATVLDDRGVAGNVTDVLQPPSRGGGLRVVPLDRLEQLAVVGTDEEPPAPVPAPMPDSDAELPDLADLRGQPLLRRALEIAAAGGHGMLMVGPPGAGKSLAARRLPSILPPLTERESLDVRRIASACGSDANSARRPFRAPHHTISVAGLVGGGSPPRAGEVTFAHRGVLFLDEIGEFSRSALEALRQPLEDGNVTIARAHHRVDLPCRFMLVAAANPCPCGRGDSSSSCTCSPVAVRRYGARLSGALADRIDILLAVEQPDAEALAGGPGESSAPVRERVAAARERQARRLGDGLTNGAVDSARCRSRTRLTPSARTLLLDGQRRLELSGRGHDRVLRVARTVADLADAERVGEEHVAEALSMRRREGE